MTAGSAPAAAVGHNPALDGLRAIGVVLVVGYHVVAPVQTGGYVGVDLFFTLSGYLITALLLAELDRSGTIGLVRFYLRRLVRLYPALLVTMLVCLIPGILLAKDVGAYLIEVAIAAVYLTPFNVTFWHIGWPWAHTWSLGIEQLFYLGWPLLLRWLLKRGVGRDLLAGVLLCVGAAMIAWQAMHASDTGALNVFLRASGVVIGCALALWMCSRPDLHVRPRWAYAAMAVMGVAVAVGGQRQFEALAVGLTVPASAVLVAHTVTGSSRLNALLAMRPMVYVGAISYELYLWHYPLLTLAAWAFARDYLELAWVVVPTFVLAALTHAVLVAPQARWRKVADRHAPGVARAIREATGT